MLLTLLQNTGITPTIVWIKVGGIWKQAIPYIKVGGVWKQANFKIKISGEWK